MLCNTMICTKNIRRNVDRKRNYVTFLKDINILLKKYPNFPENCRNIGSYLTNIVQCSQDEREKAWAQCVNVFIQMEKLHIAFSSSISTHHNIEHQFKYVEIFEPLSKQGDLFANVFKRDMKGVESFPLVHELYKRALKNLLSEKRTITYQLYHNTNPYIKKSIDKLIFLMNIVST